MLTAQCDILSTHPHSHSFYKSVIVLISYLPTLTPPPFGERKRNAEQNGRRLVKGNAYLSTRPHRKWLLYDNRWYRQSFQLGLLKKRRYLK